MGVLTGILPNSSGTLKTYFENFFILNEQTLDIAVNSESCKKRESESKNTWKKNSLLLFVRY